MPGGSLTLPTFCRLDASLTTGLAVRACQSLGGDDRDHVVAADELATDDLVAALLHQLRDHVVELADELVVHLVVLDDRGGDLARVPTGEVSSLLRSLLERAVQPLGVDALLLRHDALLPL